MKVIYGIGNFKKAFPNAVAAIGVFDGVHRGHQALIREAVHRARRNNAPALVITFFPHPVRVVRPEIALPYIVSLPLRLKLIGELGAQACLVVRFTKRFARLSPERFIRRYIVSGIKPKEILVGDDFRFGQGRRGTLDYFREAGHTYGFRVNAVGAVKTGSGKIGSSIIRKLIMEGKLSEAASLLGRRVAVMGRVLRGDGRGKRLGFPTANISVKDGVIPPLGVYAVLVNVGAKTFRAMANIGRRPSFKKNDPVHVETHLFDFHGNLYGKEIIVEFVKKIREEKKFRSPAQFITQLRGDRVRAQRILSK